MRILPVSLFLSAVLVLGYGAVGSKAQFPRPLQNPGRGAATPPNTPTIDRDGRDTQSANPLAAVQEAQRVKAMANDRQRKIVDDTAKLLQLATELKNAVDKTTKDQLSVEVIRKADEVE